MRIVKTFVSMNVLPLMQLISADSDYAAQVKPLIEQGPSLLLKALGSAVRLRQRISDAARRRRAARQLEVRDRYCRGR
jgi:hypothetical protein